MSSKLKINLFGELWKLSSITLSNEEKTVYETIADQIRKPLHHAIVDPYFYHILQDKKIQSIENLNSYTWEGLLNSPKNQIEIWYNGRKIKKIKINDLNNDLLLFPLYSSTTKKITSFKEGIYVIQKELGLIGSYEILLDKFSIDNLRFHILEIQGNEILQFLYYENLLLVSKKK